MHYISVSEASKKWNISVRSVRNYCAEGRVNGAILVGKSWLIPEGAEKPIRKIRIDAAPETLLEILKREKNASKRANQEYYINLLDDWSFASFIYPENRERVMNELEEFFYSGGLTHPRRRS